MILHSQSSKLFIGKYFGSHLKISNKINPDHFFFSSLLNFIEIVSLARGISRHSLPSSKATGPRETVFSQNRLNFNMDLKLVRN